MASPQLKDDKMGLPPHIDSNQSPTRDSHEIVNVQGGDLLNLESVDPVLNAKMKLVNDAIDEIGFTGYQAKLFVLNGFGYVTNTCCVRSARRHHGQQEKAAAHNVQLSAAGDFSVVAAESQILR
jgi:hypothetical protein